MKAMIFTAGFGTRMGDLSNHVPKPCLPYMGRPLIGHQLAWLSEYGVDQVVMNLHHLGDQVRATAEAHRPIGMDLVFLNEPTIRGTGGGLINATALLYDEPEFLAINGDIVTNIDLRIPIRSHRHKQSLITLVLTGNTQHADLFGVGINADGEITDFWGEPANGASLRRAAFTGIHVINPDFLSQLPPTGYACIKEQGYLPALHNKTALHGVVMNGDWFDVGTPERYMDAHFSLLEEAPAWTGHTARSPGIISAEPLPPSLRVQAPVVVGPGLQLMDPNAQIGPGAFLGANVTLGAGASIQQSIVWDDTIVEGNCHHCIASPEHTVGVPQKAAEVEEEPLDES